MDEGSDMRGVVNGITLFVPSGGVVGSRVELELVDDLAVETVDHVLHGEGLGKATHHEFLDHPVDGRHDLVDFLVAAEAPLYGGVTKIRLLILVVIGDVIPVELLGVVSASKAEVRVGGVREVTNLPSIEGRSLLSTGESSVMELRVVEELGCCLEAGNSPLDDRESLVGG